MPLTLAAVFQVDAVTRTDELSRFWFGSLRTLIKYSVIAVIKNFCQHQHLNIKVFGKVLVPTHYSFQLIYNTLDTVLENGKDAALF